MAGRKKIVVREFEEFAQKDICLEEIENAAAANHDIVLAKIYYKTPPQELTYKHEVYCGVKADGRIVECISRVEIDKGMIVSVQETYRWVRELHRSSWVAYNADGRIVDRG